MRPPRSPLEPLVAAACPPRTELERESKLKSLIQIASYAVFDVGSGPKQLPPVSSLGVRNLPWRQRAVRISHGGRSTQTSLPLMRGCSASLWRLYHWDALASNRIDDGVRRLSRLARLDRCWAYLWAPFLRTRGARLADMYFAVDGRGLFLVALGWDGLPRRRFPCVPDRIARHPRFSEKVQKVLAHTLQEADCVPSPGGFVFDSIWDRIGSWTELADLGRPGSAPNSGCGSCPDLGASCPDEPPRSKPHVASASRACGTC